MAAAGMPTVTSTFANKDAAALCGLSPNLIGATPTVEGVLEGLRRAAGRLDDLQGRAAGAGFAWPRCAAEAFDEPTLDRLDQLIEAARPR
jgi:hypothetical protein